MKEFLKEARPDYSKASGTSPDFGLGKLQFSQGNFALQPKRFKEARRDDILIMRKEVN
jgi:hypothetical protein